MVNPRQSSQASYLRDPGTTCVELSALFTALARAPGLGVLDGPAKVLAGAAKRAGGDAEAAAVALRQDLLELRTGEHIAVRHLSRSRKKVLLQSIANL